MSVPPRAKKTILERITSSVPLLVTVIIHVILIIVAGAFVVQEQILKPKKKFEAAAATETTAQKQIEHRLQVARKSSATSSSNTPISANRIYSSAEGALQLPEMPDLPSMGGGGFGGFGGGVEIGAGTGGAGGIGNTSLGGRGFMSLSFLGMTSQNVSKIVFVLDISTELMDIRKGGFQAFQIIREQIMQLVNRLPPSAEFGVILFERGAWGGRGRVAAFRSELMSATVANKEEFFRWLTPINTDPKRTGIASAPSAVPYKPKALPPNSGVDEDLQVPDWAWALRQALEMQPDTIYVITGDQGSTRRKASDAEIAKRKREYDEKVADLKKRGIPDVQAAMKARSAAYEKAKKELEAINEKLKAQGKQPLVARVPERIFDKDFQAELAKLGFSIKLDGKGWSDKDGKTIGWVGYVTHADVPFTENYNYIARLQAALVPKKANINVFLFVGPNEQPKQAMENLGRAATRNSGRFELLTTKRLEELKRRAAEENK